MYFNIVFSQQNTLQIYNVSFLQVSQPILILLKSVWWIKDFGSNKTNPWIPYFPKLRSLLYPNWPHRYSAKSSLCSLLTWSKTYFTPNLQQNGNLDLKTFLSGVFFSRNFVLETKETTGNCFIWWHFQYKSL